jgi:PUA domain protein
MNIKQRHFIQKSQIKELQEDILKRYDEKFLNQIFPKKARVEVIQTEAGDTLYAINNVLKLWRSKDGYIPVLTLLFNKQVDLKEIAVDKGAIRFVSNNADIFRAGITEIDKSIKKGDILQIVDENNHRAIAVGKAMYDAKEMESMNDGKVIKNLLCVKSKVWNFIKHF